MTTIRMTAPGQAAGVNITTKSGNTYTSDVNGAVLAALNDVNSLQDAGFIEQPTNGTVTLALSTAAGVYVLPGTINQIPVSTIAAVCLLPVPSATQIGSITRLVAASTGNFVITSSGVTILTEKAAATTVLTCTTGTCDMLAVGSTLYQILNRSIISNTSAAVTYGIAAS